MVRTLIWLLMAAVVAGCSMMGIGEKTEFACNKKQEGYGCSSVEAVYKATNSANYRSELAAGPTRDGEAAKPQAPAPAASAAVTPLSPPNWPAPVIEPPSVLRIWIAPWVDDKKALHWPSYVFAEVTPRKWSYGNIDFRASHQLVPLQVDPRRTDEMDSPPTTPQPPANRSKP